jgi:hypothetical protein
MNAGVGAALVIALLPGTTGGQRPASAREPIIDMHLHAFGAATVGRPPVFTCVAPLTFLPRDPKDAFVAEQFAECQTSFRSPMTDSALMAQTLTFLDRYNITAVGAGVRMSQVRAWKAAGGSRIIPAIGGGNALNLDSLRAWVGNGSLKAIAELTFQYEGLRASDSAPDQILALAEELDVPVGIHVGPGAPGAAYGSSPAYRMRLSNALELEDALVRHPKLRLYVMHAGWPFAEQTIALLYAHPQVYVDVSLIDWYLPRPEFYVFLRRLVDAGFGKRIMFGSDQVVWPEVIPRAIAAIEEAPFLSRAQRRDIFYNNAARFLRLPPK